MAGWLTVFVDVPVETFSPVKTVFDLLREEHLAITPRSRNMKWSDYRILLVDDEPDILEFLSYNLRNEGFEIHTASNGREAVVITRELNPHLDLLDVMMPVMDGICCLRGNPGQRKY